MAAFMAATFSFYLIERPSIRLGKTFQKRFIRINDPVFLQAVEGQNYPGDGAQFGPVSESTGYVAEPSKALR
jgi:hypothetical protein